MDNARSKFVPTDKLIGEIFPYFTSLHMWRTCELDGEAFHTNQFRLDVFRKLDE